MGKVTLTFEVDESLVRDLEARGIDPMRFAEAGFSDAYTRAQRWNWVDSAREKAKDPAGAERRAQDWAEANREAIAEHNAWVAEHGHLSDYDFFKPRWAR